MLSAMLRSAAPALESFSTALFALRDITDAPRRDAAMEILKTGGSFSKAVASLGLADGVMARMCAVGERSGKIADMIEMINEYYLENLQNSIERLAEVLEPLIIFFTGIFIAALILSVFLPIIKITMGGI
jgi:type II secretory pathway component PulF